MEERYDVAEHLIATVRSGIDAARFFARHEAITGMTCDDPKLVELASAVEQASAELDTAMLALLEHTSDEAEEETVQSN